MFDYIVCLYFGSRRGVVVNQLISQDKYSLLKKHLAFLKNNPDVLSKINKIIFVINSTGNHSKEEIIEIISTFEIPNVELIERFNIDYSYGAWHEALIHGLSSCPEYAFLCEDDYLPTSSNFYEPFINLFDANTAYVCQLFVRNHASIANGFISYSKCAEVFQKHGAIFKLRGAENDYRLAEWNQIMFLQLFAPYAIKDITSQFCSKFLEPNGSVSIYGNIYGSELIAPIMNT